MLLFLFCPLCFCPLHCLQNLYMSFGAASSCEAATTAWYNELPDYDRNTTNFSKWGHFSQLVWKSTTKLGCGYVACPGNKYMVTCRWAAGHLSAWRSQRGS